MEGEEEEETDKKKHSDKKERRKREPGKRREGRISNKGNGISFLSPSLDENRMSLSSPSLSFFVEEVLRAAAKASLLFFTPESDADAQRTFCNTCGFQKKSIVYTHCRFPHEDGI